jgi:hypothetical protein
LNTSEQIMPEPCRLRQQELDKRRAVIEAKEKAAAKRLLKQHAEAAKQATSSDADASYAIDRQCRGTLFDIGGRFPPTNIFS